MKWALAAGALAAAAAAAATATAAAAVAAAASSDGELFSCGGAALSFAGRRRGLLLSEEEGSARAKTAEEKFSPRFDGLRFIETLVTAHR